MTRENNTGEFSPAEIQVVNEYTDAGTRLLRESKEGAGWRNFLKSVVTGRFPQWLKQQSEGGRKEAEAIGLFRKTRRTVKELQQLHRISR